MNLDTAHKLALSRMNDWGLLESGWRFSFNNRKTALGVCRYKHKEIQLSRIITEHADGDAVLDVILHEIAHAKAGPRAKHGYIWQAMARMVGAKPHRGANVNAKTRVALIREIKYVMVCSHGIIHKTYYRKPARKTFRDIHLCYVHGRRTETLGRMVLEVYSPTKHLLK